MWHRLALAMGMPVVVLQQVMPSSEFTHWIAFYKAEPFGYEIENWRAAMIAATVAQSQGAKVKLEQFLPTKREAVDPVDVAKAWVSALGHNRDNQIPAAG